MFIDPADATIHSTGKVKEKSYYPLFKRLCDKENLVIPEFNYANDSVGTLNLWNTEFGKSEKLHHIIDTLQKELGNKGQIVVEGKLAITMIENADLKIWLKASLDTRAKRSSERDSIDLETAKDTISKRLEKERSELYRIYGIDYLEQEKKADLVVDTASLSPEEIVDEILNSLSARASKISSTHNPK